MKDNTIKVNRDEKIAVYDNKVGICVDEYIGSLDADSDDERKMLIRKAPVFRGMCKYVFEHVFKIGKGEIRYNNKSSNIDYADVDMLDHVWAMYTSLCYKYLSAPTFLNFAIFSGIDDSTLVSWYNGDYRDDSNRDVSTTDNISTVDNLNSTISNTDDGNDIYINNIHAAADPLNDRQVGDPVGSSHSSTVKRWKKECEAALYDVAMGGGIGGMFLLKANYGYSEGAQQITLTNGDAGKTIDQIAAEHRPQIAQASDDTDDMHPPAADF